MKFMAHNLILKSYLSNPSRIFKIEAMEAMLWLTKCVYFFYSPGTFAVFLLSAPPKNLIYAVTECVNSFTKRHNTDRPELQITIREWQVTPDFSLLLWLDLAVMWPQHHVEIIWQNSFSKFYSLRIWDTLKLFAFKNCLRTRIFMSLRM